MSPYSTEYEQNGIEINNKTEEICSFYVTGKEKEITKKNSSIAALVTCFCLVL